MTFPRVAAVLFAVSAVSFPVRAQSVISTHSGVVYFFEGSVWLGDQRLEQKFGKFPDVGAGRELRTEEGRAEVLLTPGMFLRLGENSRIRMISCSLADTRVELLSGSAIVEAKDPAPNTSAVVIYKGWQLRVPQRGIYRIDAEPPQLHVFKGEAEVLSADNKEPVAVKEEQTLPLAAVLVPEQAPAALGDAFDRWAMERSQAVYADDATAAQIITDPSAVDTDGLALGGLSYFPMTSIPSLGTINPYGLSFWSPFQPALLSLYSPGYLGGWAYPGLRLFQLYPPSPYGTRRPLFPTWPGVRPGGSMGLPATRVPVYTTPRLPSHPVVGAHPVGHR